MLRICRKYRKDEDGATAIEYGLIAGLISVVIIGALQLVASSMDSNYDYISSTIQEALAENQ
jgi:pilus assembly protein Flp/PilA